MIVKHCLLHCEDPDVVGEARPAHFVSAWTMLALDEDQALELMRFYLTDAVVDILGQLREHGRRVWARTAWWAETDMTLEGDDWDDADDHHAMELARG